MVTTDPSEFENLPAVLVFSDAPTHEAAIQEINTWARDHGFVRTSEYHLGIRQSKDGRRLFYSPCYRLTEDDDRAAAADLTRIRARREAMPMTVPSDQLLRDDD